jgi:hypothetical protein
LLGTLRPGQESHLYTVGVVRLANGIL